METKLIFLKKLSTYERPGDVQSKPNPTLNNKEQIREEKY